MLSQWEKKAFESGYAYVIGIDEAGRGPVCGPVTCGAFCWVRPESIQSYEWAKSITDSKAIKESDRDEIYNDLIACERENQTSPQQNFIYKVVNGSVEEIDDSDILAVTLRCMATACDEVLAELRNRKLLSPMQTVADPESGDKSDDSSCEERDGEMVKVLIDGNKIPPQLLNREEIATESVVKGDLKVFTISCASIVAKCSRDQEMRELHQKYPEYQLDVHKGYLTAAHKAALERHGPSSIHRLTFEPCRSQLLNKRFPVPAGRSMEPVERKERLKNLPRTKMSKAERDSMILADRHVTKTGHHGKLPPGLRNVSGKSVTGKATSGLTTSGLTTSGIGDPSRRRGTGSTACGGVLKRLWSMKECADRPVPAIAPLSVPASLEK